MLRYYLYIRKRTLKPGKARIFFNTSFLSKKKRNNILSKSGIVLKANSTITAPFYFEFGKIDISENVLINANCTFLDNEKITIKNDTMIGPNVTLTTVSHYTCPEKRHNKNITLPIFIGENVWIGAGVIVLPGITIGNNSIIAANSVVNTDIPENSLYAGAPAQFKRKL